MKVSFAVLCSVTEVKTKSKISDGLTDLIVPKVMSSRLCGGVQKLVDLTSNEELFIII